MHNPAYPPDQNPHQDPRYQHPGQGQGQPPPYLDPNNYPPGGGAPPPYQDPRYQHPGAMQGQQPPAYPDPNYPYPGGGQQPGSPSQPPSGKPPTFYEIHKKKLIIGGVFGGLLILIIVMMSSCGGDDPADVATNATPTPIPVAQLPAESEPAADIDQQVTELAQQMAREQMEIWLKNNPTATPLFARDNLEPYAPQHFLEDYINNCIHPHQREGTTERRSLETSVLLNLAGAAEEFIDHQCPKDDRVSTFILDLLHPPVVPTEEPPQAESEAEVPSTEGTQVPPVP